jgi:aryl-alcohol dehydrogenase-like predicted oxidoreductase
MSLNHYVTLGRSGLRVSPLCLGTMTFGEDLGWGSSVQESEAILARYLDLGGNFLDTANIYTFGHSEKILGDWFAARPGLRDRVVLATKFYGNLYPGDPNGGGAGRKSLTAAVHQSLRRLQTDYLDLLWMHAWDRHTPIEETMRALDDLVRAGDVRYLGFSDTPAWKTAQAQVTAHLRSWTPVTALQIEYSLLERTVEGELVPMAQELGLGITPWSPLRGGLLSGKYTRANAGQVTAKRAWTAGGLNEKAYTVIDVLLDVARQTGSTAARVALAWLLAKPGVTSPILGATSVAQLDDNLASLEVKLSAEQLKALDAASTPQLNFPAGFLSRAGSFMHGGISVNGDNAVPSVFGPKTDSKIW